MANGIQQNIQRQAPQPARRELTAGDRVLGALHGFTDPKGFFEGHVQARAAEARTRAATEAAALKGQQENARRALAAGQEMLTKAAQAHQAGTIDDNQFSGMANMAQAIIAENASSEDEAIGIIQSARTQIGDRVVQGEDIGAPGFIGVRGEEGDLRLQRREAGGARVNVTVGPDGQPVNPRVAQVLDPIFEGSRTAGDQLVRLGRAREILMNPDFQSGLLEEGVMGVQRLANSLGTNFDSVLGKVFPGLTAGDIDTKEEFRALSQQMALDNMENIKGNANPEEVAMVQEAATQVGKSEEANSRYLALTQAIAERSEARGKAIFDVGLDPVRQEGLAREFLNESASTQALLERADAIHSETMKFREPRIRPADVSPRDEFVQRDGDCSIWRSPDGSGKRVCP